MEMTPREQIAAMALQGLISTDQRDITIQDMTTWSVQVADSLIAELERTKPKEECEI